MENGTLVVPSRQTINNKVAPADRKAGALAVVVVTQGCVGHGSSLIIRGDIIRGAANRVS